MNSISNMHSCIQLPQSALDGSITAEGYKFLSTAREFMAIWWWEKKKKKGKVEDIKCLSLKIAVRTNQQETHIRAIYRLSMAFLVTGPDFHIITNRWFIVSIFTDREAFFRGYLRRCWSWSALTSLQKHPKSWGFGFVWANRWGSSPNLTTSLCHQPCTMSAPGTPPSAGASLLPSLTASLDRSAASPPKTKLPQLCTPAAWPLGTWPAPGSCAPSFLFLTPSSHLKCLCPRD